MCNLLDFETTKLLITMCFSVLGILAIFGIHQSRMFKKWLKIYRQNTWRLYQEISVLLNELKSLQEKIESNKNINFELGKLTGHAQDMMDNQIKQIDINERVTHKKIDKWVKSGRIVNLTDKIIFKKFVGK